MVCPSAMSIQADMTDYTFEERKFSAQLINTIRNK